MPKVSRPKQEAKAQKKPSPEGPVWKGPEEDGVTYSLLSRFLVCRERFRALVVDGMKPAPRFHAALDYGSMWHVCEEFHAEGQAWEGALETCCRDLCRQHPMQREEINHWYSICKAQFPLYVKHWSKHPDVKNRVPLAQEHEFNVPYRLPSGRTVRLRGKIDALDLIKTGEGPGVWIQENKSKSSIDQEKIGRQLTFDLQTMIYMIAARHEHDRMGWAAKGPLMGVRYNVIRRSAHKSVESYLKKITEDREDGRIGEWFSRWMVRIHDHDVKRFRRECLDPILEQLCDWWSWIKASPTDPFDNSYEDENGVQLNGCETEGDRPVYGYVHWRHPFGVYNVLDEGGSSDLDHYVDSGSTVGLERVENLFPELS